MRSDLLKKILEKSYKSDSRTTDKGTRYICRFEKEEFLHILFYGLDNSRKECLIADMKKFGKDTRMISQYLDFLCECNGALLYSGSINLFGYDDREDSFDDTPSSILKMNCCLKNSDILYVGNCPCSLGGNIEFYLMLSSGEVACSCKGKVIEKWNDWEAFLENIFLKFDNCYDLYGRNVNYGDSNKFVYRNIQKYIVK